MFAMKLSYNTNTSKNILLFDYFVSIIINIIINFFKINVLLKHNLRKNMNTLAYNDNNQQQITRCKIFCDYLTQKAINMLNNSLKMGEKPKKKNVSIF